MTATAIESVKSALDRLAGEGALGIACSGGGDSIALLSIASEWARATGHALHVLTVDHRLRAGSGAEADLVAATAARLGWPCHTLTWDEARTGSGLQARARTARHRLLASACRELGLTGLALAHTRDDQSETVWLRLSAGGSWRGAAAMSERAPSPAWPEGRDLVLLRPCLDVTRADLRAVLIEAGINWVDDPSNEDSRYARIRARTDLGALSDAGFQTDGLARLAAHLGSIHAVERRVAHDSASAAVSIRDWGGATISSSAWSRIPPAIRLTLLDGLVAAVSGQPQSPTRGRLQSLDTAILGAAPATGCGVQLLGGSDGVVWMIRDRGAVLGRVDQARPDPWIHDRDGTRVFDGRFEIAPDAHKLDWAILGEAYEGLPCRAILDSVPGAARAGLLVGREAGQVVTIAGLGPTLNAPVSDRPMVRSLTAHRFCRRLLPQPAARCFDEPEMA